MTPIVTFLIVAASLLHLFFVVYNRYLLSLTPGPWKVSSHYIWFFLSTALPCALILFFHQHPVVQAVFSLRPSSGAAKLLFVVLALLVIFWGARSILWLQDRVAPEVPPNLISEERSRANIPPVPSILPRILRPLDTTGDLQLVEREIAVHGMSAAFDGLRVVHVADSHIGQRLELENYHQAVVELVNSLDADVIAFTGDFLNRRRDIQAALDYHGQFQARLGCVAVLGNHDYWTRPDRIIEGLEERGIKWLGNGGRRVLKREGRRLVFSGTDYPWDPLRRDWRRSVRRETGDALVFLVHTPDIAPAAAAEGASLVLSGHNHGGQVCFPGFGPLIVPSRYGLRYAGGVYRIGGESVLNVSRGTGVSGRGVRICCPPEVCVLTLRAPAVDVMVGKVIDARQMLRQSESEKPTGGILANRSRDDYTWEG